MAPLRDGNGADEEVLRRAAKSASAFRTISEVADDLEVPQHVLRFWETKFPQIRPLKRGGGRRYYRPEDVELLRRVAQLLYQEGYTIKGVQRLLREGGGKLSDDIPPATPDEQAAAEAEREGVVPAEPEPQLLMPGLIPAEPAPQPARPSRISARAPAAAAGDAAANAEIERLRSVLAATLRELEELRALLP
jgi:DNA-binding transcriptional MerR regulator